MTSARGSSCVLLLSLGCGLSFGCGAASPASAPRAPVEDVEEPTLASSAPSAPSAPMHASSDIAALPRCEGATQAVAGLDPAPSLHALPPATPLTRASAPSSRGEPIGGDAHGFVWWQSANGRLAILMRFDGGPPRFGHHGEVFGADGALLLVDLEQGTSETLHDLIAPAPGGAAVAIRDAQDHVIVVRQDGQRLDLSALGADTRDDENRCLNGRQIGFDEAGRFVSYVAGDPAQVVVQDLETAAQCRVDGVARPLWRTAPGSTAGWVLVREVTGASGERSEGPFPVQHTSCACRWCNRFALSYGFYGWGGPGFESTWIAPDGSRLTSDGIELPVGEGALARVDRDTGTIALLAPSGAPIAPPDGCEPTAIVPGAPSAIMRCGASSRLFFPEGARELELPARVEATGIVDGLVTREGHVWAPVLVSDASGARLSRLRMNDGRIETGPPARDRVQLDAGWAVAPREGGLALLDLASGQTRTVDLPNAADVGGLFVRGERRSIVLGPAVGRWIEVDGRVDGADPRGCTLVASGAGERGIDRGPWRRVCP